MERNVVRKEACKPLKSNQRGITSQRLKVLEKVREYLLEDFRKDFLVN